MFDLEEIDKLYEGVRSGRVSLDLVSLDKRTLIPLDTISDVMAAVDGSDVSAQELRQLAAQGWCPILSMPDGSSGIPGYAPERIALLRRLERNGYTAIELRRYARWEEWYIDEILTTEELAYIDDDLEVVIDQIEQTLDAVKSGDAFDSRGNRVDPGPRIESLERTLRTYRRLCETGVPPSWAERVQRQAFRARMLREFIRGTQLQQERSAFEAGYSPGVVLSGKEWRFAGGDIALTPGPIMWEPTIRAALAQADEDSDPALIRIPGFLLTGDLVTPTRTMIPADYERAWRESDLEGYLSAWSKLSGDRRCQHCFLPLAENSDNRRRYCSEKCRNAAKQRRWREQNPDAVYESQRRYWSSLGQAPTEECS